ncbi:MAG: alpha/beta hydrolase family protein [Thiohalomonadales bacterium]
MKKYLLFCSTNEDKSCKYFKSTFKYFNKEFFQNAAQSQKDVRVKASIAIAPGFVESMTNESLNQIRIPILIIGAELDENVPPNTHFKPKFEMFSKSIKYQEISNATHFSFMQICRPKAIKILAEENEEFVCIDGGKKSRQELHDEIYNMIERFIRSQNITSTSTRTNYSLSNNPTNEK